MAERIAGRMTQQAVEEIVKKQLIIIGIKEVDIHITKTSYQHSIGVVVDKKNMGNWLAFPSYVNQFSFQIPIRYPSESMQVNLGFNGKIIGEVIDFENEGELVTILKKILHNRLDSMMERVITLENKIDDFIKSPAIVMLFDLQMRIDSILEFTKSEIPRQELDQKS